MTAPLDRPAIERIRDTDLAAAQAALDNLWRKTDSVSEQQEQVKAASRALRALIPQVRDLAATALSLMDERDTEREAAKHSAEQWVAVSAECDAALAREKALREALRSLVGDNRCTSGPETYPVCLSCAADARSLLAQEPEGKGPTHRPHCDGCDYHGGNGTCWCPHAQPTERREGQG